MKISSANQLVTDSVKPIELTYRSIAKIICFGMPMFLLVASYIHMAFKYDQLWLFDTIVHERGKYNLLEVIFYFRHFLWELPMKTLFAFILVGIFYYFGNPFPEEQMNKNIPIPSRVILWSGLIALLIACIAFMMTTLEHGFKEALLGFFQSRASELRPLQYGSHWRNHFLSNIVLYCTSVAAVLLYRLIINEARCHKRTFWFLFPLSAGFFILITLIFGFTMDPFQTPSYLGHQLREIFGSDLTITMLLTIGILICLEEKYDITSVRDRLLGETNRKKLLRHVLFWLIPAVIISLFLIFKVLNLDISNEMSNLGSTEGWTKIDLFAWHFYEHSLDYLYSSALVVFVYLTTLRIEMRRRLT